MMRFLLRFLGLWILAAAFIFLIYDGTKSIADRSTFFITRTSDIWSAVHQNSLIALKPMIDNAGLPWVWDPGITSVLQQPAWLVFGIIGILLILLGRKKRPLIGYSRD